MLLSQSMPICEKYCGYNKAGNHDEDFGDGRGGILRLQPV